MKFNYEDCSKYVKERLGVTLFDYQEAMLKAFCDGLKVRTARCVGRSEVANAFGKYVAHVVGENNYDEEPEVMFTYLCAVANGLMSEKSIDRIKGTITEAEFKKEYCCE